ncbi:MAG: glycosyltransferase family 2 protein [Puniceicoccales bacterium]
MISIVIPLYNKAHTIERTIQSVIRQNFKDWEIVIVDDGSTDRSLDKVNTLSIEHNFTIISQENQGVSAARNKGVKESKFDYIAFLDGDDEWDPNYLNKIIETIETAPHAGMICCAGKVRDADGTEHLRLAKKYINKIVEINFFENPHVFLHTSSTVVKKSAFNQTDGFPVGMKRNEDFALFYSLAFITPVVYCGFPLSIYNGGVAGQATETPFNQVTKHHINRFNHVHNNYLRSNRSNRLYPIFIRYELRHILLNSLKKRDYKTIEKYKTDLSKDIRKLLLPFEINFYSFEIFRKTGIYFIYATKLAWRIHNFPKSGELQQ